MSRPSKYELLRESEYSVELAQIYLGDKEAKDANYMFKLYETALELCTDKNTKKYIEPYIEDAVLDVCGDGTEECVKAFKVMIAFKR